MRSEMCSLHLTHPSGAVGSRHCRARGAVGWGFGALLKGLTSVEDTSCQSWDSNPQPWVTSGFKSNALFVRPRLPQLWFIRHCICSTCACVQTSNTAWTHWWGPWRCLACSPGSWRGVVWRCDGERLSEPSPPLPPLGSLLHMCRPLRCLPDTGSHPPESNTRWTHLTLHLDLTTALALIYACGYFRLWLMDWSCDFLSYNKARHRH